MKKMIPSMLAGMFIAFGAMVSQYATTITGNKLAGALLFPIGLSMVVVIGADLFTGKCLLLMKVIGKEISISQMASELAKIYAGNLVGSLLAAAAAYGAGIQNSVDVVTSAVGKCSLTIPEIIIKAIMCNILVCTAVYMSRQETSAAKKIIAVYLPVVVFVLCGFEHSIADMYFLPVAYFADSSQLTLTAIVTTIVLATAGNIIGGFMIAVCFSFMGAEKLKAARFSFMEVERRN